MAELNERGRPVFEPSGSEQDAASGTATEWEWARGRVERKAKFRADLVAYIVINMFLVGVWALNDSGSFWPGWVLSIWGVLLLLDAWNAFGRRPLTEADIDRELHHTR